MNLPNKLTISRVLMIPLFVLFFYLNFAGHYFVAVGVFALACITDFLDGYIARKYKLVTNLGKFLDPIADKVLVATAMIILLTKPEVFTANFGEWALVFAGCGVALIIAREIIVSGFRMVAADAGIV
ncbi:MAG: CDP-diacylglycerol--glycerol-3-phosphate 3-phosphatidyltransferase, partial [Clostridia bacterium]|nr:CDP-diacylglycerol--glycerol-3-phosphate 3-phosphatidyltransferase [Clostridia bacterium]